MARILYLHGSQPGSFGDKTEDAERHGHQADGRRRRPDPRYSTRM